MAGVAGSPGADGSPDVAGITGANEFLVLPVAPVPMEVLALMSSGAVSIGISITALVASLFVEMHIVCKKSVYKTLYQ